MRTVQLLKEVWVPANKPFIFKEKIDPTTGKKKYIMRGLLLPFDKISRNNVLYNRQSIEDHHRELIGRPLMYNHKIEGNELPKGHFIESYTVNVADEKHPEPGWYYAADVDPMEVDTIRKLERGDLRHVSIQLVGGTVDEKMGDDGPYSEAHVSDIIEGSLVPAPGFLDTTAEFAECFGRRTKENLNVALDKLAMSLYKKPFSMLSADEQQKVQMVVSKEDFMSVDDKYKTPSYDGDLQVAPYELNDEEVKQAEAMAERFMGELGEKAVRDLIKTNY